MSGRAGDWWLVGYPSDPVPADGTDVRIAAGQFAGRAAVLETAHDVLDRLSRLDGWNGDAAETFASSAREAVGDLHKASQKYADVATALTSFSGEVDTARTRTQAALTRATAGDAIRRANATDPNFAITNPTLAQADESMSVARAHQQGVDELSGAQADLTAALNDLQDAVQQAKRAIDTASDHFSDGFWDDVSGLIRSIADQLDVVIKAGRPGIRRRRRHVISGADADGPSLWATTVDYIVETDPDTLLVLTFSTTTDPVADALVSVFDAIDSSLHAVAEPAAVPSQPSAYQLDPAGPWATPVPSSGREPGVE